MLGKWYNRDQKRSAIHASKLVLQPDFAVSTKREILARYNVGMATSCVADSMFSLSQEIIEPKSLYLYQQSRATTNVSKR